MTTTLTEDGLAVDALQRAETLYLDAKRHTDEFLATLGHEMRNPLSALSNALQLWQRVNHDPEQLHKLQELMQRQVQQLTRLSDDLVDVARIAQGKLELRQEPVGLRELLDDAVEEVRPFIDRCGHVLTVTLPAEPVFLSGDASRLVQVFANLIQNAAKFTGENGCLDVCGESQDATVVVRVRDNGAGIAEHMRAAVFEAFTQVDEKGLLPERGLGIGLRLAKTIVEMHGGSISVRSEGLGQGSEFTVRLPSLAVLNNRPAQAEMAR